MGKQLAVTVTKNFTFCSIPLKVFLDKEEVNGAITFRVISCLLGKNTTYFLHPKPFTYTHTAIWYHCILPTHA